MIDLSNLSQENLEKIQKVLKIILDTIELQELNKLTCNNVNINKIPLKSFDNNGFSYTEVKIILDGINAKDDFVEIHNENLKKYWEEIRKKPFVGEDWHKKTFLEICGIPIEDLENYLILTIKDIAKLKSIKEGVDKKLVDRITKAKIRKEEREEKDEKNKIFVPKTFEIQVRDRYIWVNNYLLSKPHAVGTNLEFFEYIRSKPANTKIERKNLPDFGRLALKEQVKGKSFIKILNKLGFKGEILKAFFPKRGKNVMVYRGNKITKKDLEKAGVKILLFLKELEVAHIKNSPE